MPAGAHLTINLTGGATAPDPVAGRAIATAFTALDQTSFQADRGPDPGRPLAVSARRRRRWPHGTSTVVADQPPAAWWTEPPGPSEASTRIRLPWSASDDYGVIDLQAELRLSARPDAPPLMVADPVAGRRAEIRPRHPSARPDRPSLGRAAGDRPAGRPGRRRPDRRAATPRRSTLPERPFHNAIAQDADRRCAKASACIRMTTATRWRRWMA